MSEASAAGSDDERAPSIGAPVAQGLLLGTLVALICTLPAAARAASGGASPVVCWVILCGGTALVLGPVVAALRVSRPWPAAAASVPLGLVLALAPLIVFGRVIKAGTHHRPLGGATYAIVAVGLVLGAIAVSARLIALARSQRWARAAVTALAVLCALAGLAMARGAFGAGSGGVGIGVVDGAIALVLAGGAALLRVPAPIARVARIAGPVLWLAVAIAGPVAGRAVPAARSATLEQAPVLAGPGAWLDR